MFSGIIETQTQVKRTEIHPGTVTIFTNRPSGFNDIHVGDSIAHNGVCLTLESFTDNEMQFTLGKETLQVTGWTSDSLTNMNFNVERSLRFGDRVHGHIVLGHVDAKAKVVETETIGDNFILTIEFPKKLKPLMWQKGSVTLNGVSLTINKVEDCTLQVGLIPETLKVTNLKSLTKGDGLTIEADNAARGLIRYFEVKNQEQSL